jgi:hypothetical protein
MSFAPMPHTYEDRLRFGPRIHSCAGREVAFTGPLIFLYSFSEYTESLFLRGEYTESSAAIFFSLPELHTNGLYVNWGAIKGLLEML